MPKLPVVLRELECVGARTDRQLRLHIEDKVSKLGAEISATNSTCISASADVAAMKSTHNFYQQELRDIKDKVHLFWRIELTVIKVFYLIVLHSAVAAIKRLSN